MRALFLQDIVEWKEYERLLDTIPKQKWGKDFQL